MKKILPLIAVGTLAAFSSAQAVDIWVEDFEGATLGATSGNNGILAGTVIKTANTAGSLVVDASTDPTAAAAFTLASGKFISLSAGDNDFSAVASSAVINFAALADTDTYTFSFDIYIPADLDVAVGSINPRLESSGASGNGSTFSNFATLTAGQHSISYTGTIASIKNANSVGNADTANPFIFIEQKINGADDGTTALGFMYMDNISFTVVPEPSTYALFAGALALGAVMVRRRRA